MDVTLFLWNSLMACLAVALVAYLASFRRPVLLALVMALSFVSALHFARLPMRDTEELMGFIKLMALLPLGLGSLLVFACLTEKQKTRYHSIFNAYVNCAVIANILIMMFTPAGETIRGHLSRLLCLLILVWLLLEMTRHRFQTSLCDQGFFIFRASPLNWVLCHAGYRMALLSLPVFDSLHYVLLEPLSLGTMWLLYRLHPRRHPPSHYFGYADTLAVTTLAVLSRYPIAPPFPLASLSMGNLSQSQLDMLFVPLQILIAGLVLRAIVKRLRPSRQRPWSYARDCEKLPTGKAPE